MMDQDTKDFLENSACDGERITWTPAGEKPKTIWPGLGNRAGLYEGLIPLLQDKWEKSG